MSDNSPVLVLIDGHAYAYRSFFAIKELRGPDGRPTNAIFGFIKAVGRIREELKPTHMAVIWDGGLSSDRLKLLPGYKAQRPPMPTDLEIQFDGLAEWVGAAGMHSLCHEGVEADDWIAALASKASSRGYRVIIASSDKDFMQLVSESVRLLNPGDKTGKLWGEPEVEAKAGVRPDQIVDWLALIGDAVDNIPGVPGIGPKTAAQLLAQFGSVESLLSRLEEVKSDRLRKLLAETSARLGSNRELIRLKTDLPVATSPDTYALVPENQAVLARLYAEWGFKSMLKDVQARQRDGDELPFES